MIHERTHPSLVVVLVVGRERDLLWLVVDPLPLLALLDPDGAQVAALAVQVEVVLGSKVKFADGQETWIRLDRLIKNVQNFCKIYDCSKDYWLYIFGDLETVARHV